MVPIGLGYGADGLVAGARSIYDSFGYRDKKTPAKRLSFVESKAVSKRAQRLRQRTAVKSAPYPILKSGRDTFRPSPHKEEKVTAVGYPVTVSTQGLSSHFTSNATRNGGAVVTGRGYLGNLASTDAIPAYKTMFTMNLTPDEMKEPRLGVYPQLYEQFRLIDFKVHYTPVCSTATAGQIVAFVDPDPVDLVPDTLAGLISGFSHEGATPTNMYAGHTFKMPFRPGQNWMFTTLEAKSTNDYDPDTRWESYGRFNIMSTTPLPASTVFGTLWMDYTIEFAGPQFTAITSTLQQAPYFADYAGDSEAKWALAWPAAIAALNTEIPFSETGYVTWSATSIDEDPTPDYVDAPLGVFVFDVGSYVMCVTQRAYNSTGTPAVYQYGLAETLGTSVLPIDDAVHYINDYYADVHATTESFGNASLMMYFQVNGGSDSDRAITLKTRLTAGTDIVLSLTALQITIARVSGTAGVRIQPDRVKLLEDKVAKLERCETKEEKKSVPAKVGAIFSPAKSSSSSKAVIKSGV
jgi:hypothetical protein